MLAALALAALPTLTRALGAADGRSYVTEICTPQGMKQVVVSEAGSARAPTLVEHPLDHCVSCVPGVDGGVPLSAAATLAVAPQRGAAPARPGLPHARARSVWSAAQARAPPLPS